VEQVSAPEGVTVRRAAPADVDAVVGIESEAFTSPWRRETFLDLMDRPGLELLVMEHVASGIIGYAVLWCIVDQGELANFAVTPEWRGRGLGDFLLLRVLDAARARGILKVYLEVRASNEQAVRLYSRHGFFAVGLRRGYYDHPREDARVMMATLG
jgi:ribosomal-protein-alanine N-acetyltransferase